MKEKDFRGSASPSKYLGKNDEHRPVIAHEPNGLVSKTGCERWVWRECEES